MTISFEFSVKDESRKQSSVSYEEKFTFAPLPLPNWQKCLNDLEDTIEQFLNTWVLYHLRHRQINMCNLYLLLLINTILHNQ